MTTLPTFEALLLKRQGRRLTISFNRPEALNAFGQVMHKEFIQALGFAARDPGSDVIVLTGEGKAFSAGGDLDRMEEIIETPSEFDQEAADAKRIIFTLLDIEKPIIARVNGAAVGLGATLALFCDVIFADETAKIGDPHVKVGLVAGDGGAIIWPQLAGFPRAKEFLMTGRLLTGAEAAEFGLVNYALPADELDTRVDALVGELLAGNTQAIRWTKVTMNLELKRIAHALMDPGMAYESLSVRSEEHRRSVRALKAGIAAKTRG